MAEKHFVIQNTKSMFGIQFNLKKFGIGLAIVIIFNLFINYGIHTFYEAPKQDDFCKPENVRKNINTKNECEVIGGLWSENIYYRERAPMPAPVQGTNYINEPVGWCDAYFTCQKKFDKINDIYKRNAFIVWIIAGILALVGSFSIISVSMLSTSFMFSGLLSLFIGTIQYWSAMQDYLRFIILGVALGILIYLAYKKLK